MPPEHHSHHPPKETRMFQNVPMQVIADMLHTLPLPITITQYLDEQREQLYYCYQVGSPTSEHPAGLRMGATPDFLEALRLSLETVMTRQTREPGQITDARPLHQEHPSIQDEWIVPEVERGEATASQAAALGLPYRHPITGETIAEWAERTMHEQKDVGEQQEEDEAAIMHELRNLPVSVNIWKREDGYIWQCYEHCGITPDFAGGVREGLLAYTRHLVSEKTRGVYRSFGELLFQTDDGYAERVIADTSKGRVVMCEQRGNIKLYRIEWTEPDGYEQNRAVYSLQEAMDAFGEVSLEQ